MSLGVFLLTFLLLLLFGMPVGFAMISSGFLYFIFSGNPLAITMLPETVFSGINVYVLTAIPFFMLAGDIMNRVGISDRLISFSNLVIGRVRGGLAQVNVLASILFAGVTGVALGDIAALGNVFIPAMEKQGYDREFSAGITAASSLVGPIIPPSTIIVLYASIMQLSVGAMFLGAIIPGLLFGLTDMIIVAIISKKRNYPKVEVKTTPRELVVGFKDASLAILMPVLMIGGLLTGIFTPTEAAGIAVIYAMIVGFVIYRSLDLKGMIESLKDAVWSSTKLFLIIAGAAVVSYVFAAQRVPIVAERIFTSITTNRHALIFIVNLFILFMGTWMDPGVSIILFAPILWPTAQMMGLNAVQFGIMIILNSNIGLCTPPIGNVLFAIVDMAKVDLFKVAKEMAPFLIANFIIVLLVGYVPALTTWLPKMAGIL